MKHSQEIIKKVFLFAPILRVQVYKMNFNNRTGKSPGLQKGKMSDESQL